ANLTTFVAPTSITANNSTSNYTISGTGVIGGPTTLTKQGSGVFTVNTSASYTGATSVQGGRLVLVGSKAWGPALTTAAGSDINGGRLVLDYTGATTPTATVLPLLVSGNNQATKFSTGNALRIGTA